MKAPAELVNGAYLAIDEMEDQICSIVAFANLMIAVTEGPEIEKAHVPGIQRLLLSILELGQSLQTHQGDACEAIRRLPKL
jgi:hypothetical protein